MPISAEVKKNMQALVVEWIESNYLQQGDLFVVGCSTSEVAGKQIGTSGNEEIAEQIYNTLQYMSKQLGVHLVFQGCEHLNRALVIDKQTAKAFDLPEVAAVPVPEAGGAMASYAFKQMESPVLVEKVQADAGIDIGDTMIGMQLKHVAVPLRFKQTHIGKARLTAARTRPKFIGGPRAHY